MTRADRLRARVNEDEIEWPNVAVVLSPEAWEEFMRHMENPGEPTEANKRGAEFLRKLGEQRRAHDEAKRCRHCGGLRGHRAYCTAARALAAARRG